MTVYDKNHRHHRVLSKNYIGKDKIRSQQRVKDKSQTTVFCIQYQSSMLEELFNVKGSSY